MQPETKGRWPIVITTAAHSRGHDFDFWGNKGAKVIISEEPKTLTDMQ